VFFRPFRWPRAYPERTTVGKSGPSMPLYCSIINKILFETHGIRI